MRNITGSTDLILQTISVLSLLAVVFLVYTNKADDLDLWWHLKAGEYIYKTHSIPDKDNFAYTTEIPETLRDLGRSEVLPEELPSEFGHWHANLTHSWLGQTIFYVTYLGGGIKAIGLLKSVILVLAFIVLYFTMRKRGAGHVASFLTLSLVAHIARDFSYSRPQVFSFFLFVCILYLLFDYRRGGNRIYLLPAVMLLWANLHAGFVLGAGVIILFISGECLSYVLCRYGKLKSLATIPSRRVPTLILIGLSSLIASLVNPNGYKVFLLPLGLQHSLFVSFIEEYTRPMLYEYHSYWFMFLLVGISILFRLKRLDLSEVFLAIVLMASSFSTLRVIVFFALGSSVFLAQSLTDMGRWLEARTPVNKFLEHLNTLAPATKRLSNMLLAAASVVLLFKISTSGRVLAFETSEYRYPTDAFQFIQRGRFPGQLFNLYDWGGYLIWSLPNHKVFVDGRCLSETTLFHYKQILNAAKGKGEEKPLWKRLLAAYDVQLILTKALDGGGNPIALVNELFFDPGWNLIYQDGKSMIFLKDSQKNRMLRQKYVLDKKKGIYDEIISESRQGIEMTPATWGYYETMGYVYMKQYEIEKAKEMFRQYLKMNPYNQRVIKNLNMLDNLPTSSSPSAKK